MAVPSSRVDANSDLADTTGLVVKRTFIEFADGNHEASVPRGLERRVCSDPVLCAASVWEEEESQCQAHQVCFDIAGLSDDETDSGHASDRALLSYGGHITEPTASSSSATCSELDGEDATAGAKRDGPHAPKPPPGLEGTSGGVPGLGSVAPEEEVPAVEAVAELPEMDRQALDRLIMENQRLMLENKLLRENAMLHMENQLLAQNVGPSADWLWTGMGLQEEPWLSAAACTQPHAAARVATRDELKHGTRASARPQQQQQQQQRQQQEQRTPLREGRFHTLTDVAPPATSARPPSALERLRGSVSFRWQSILGLFVALQVLVFFISCWLVPPRRVITPSWQALWKLGSSNSQMERCAVVVGGKFVWEVRRLVVAIFLHNGVPHILMNLIFQALSGPKALDAYGSRAFACLFLVSGLCGNLLSDAFGMNGVGASTACYGLIGAFLAQLCLAWPEMDAQQRWLAKVNVLANGAFLLIWEVAQWKTIDHFGHLGGLLSGLALGLALAPEASMLKRRLAAIGLSAAAAACAAKVFLVGSPEVTPALCRAQWQIYGS